MSIMQDSQNSSHWDELELDASLSAKFSDVINDDFLIVDGLDEDFSGMLDVNANSIFDDSQVDFSSDEIKDTEKEDEEKVKKVREDRSRSPTPKRRRSMTTSSPMNISPVPVKSMSSHETTSLDDLQRQYKLAIDQLAVSMRRSEMTRSEIISIRKAAETRAKLEEAQAQNFNKADGFLTGSRSTITVGLEQSRQMLRNYMGLMRNPPF